VRRLTGTAAEGSGSALGGWVHFGLSLGAFVAADEALKRVLGAAGVTFPAPLVGMFGILATLSGLAATGRLATAEAIVAAAGPALRWVQRYLPVFYMPPLVILPLAMAGLSPDELGKVGGILLFGMPFSCLLGAGLVLAIRRISAVALLPVAAHVTRAASLLVT